MAKKTDQNETIASTADNYRKKTEWIESAAALQAERFEVAGALFKYRNNQMLSETQVIEDLQKFKEGE